MGGGHLILPFYGGGTPDFTLLWGGDRSICPAEGGGHPVLVEINAPENTVFIATTRNPW